MGWWKTGGTEDVIGDEPLDVLGTAASQVVKQYEVAFGRRPTRAEWEALLLCALGAGEDEARTLDAGLVTKVHLDVEWCATTACGKSTSGPLRYPVVVGVIAFGVLKFMIRLGIAL